MVDALFVLPLVFLLFFVKPEINLFFQKIGSPDFNFHGIANLELSAVTFSDEAEFFFVEVVEVVVQLADGDHSFAEVFFNFHVKSPFGDPGNNSLVYFADFVAHELDLFVFN